jgi:eukaryotic-like serine/threonine-protein kinase
MGERSDQCEKNRLRLSLEERLTELEEAELEAHLEACRACQAELERMAAASKFWGDAHLLRRLNDADAPPTVGIHAGRREELESEDALSGEEDSHWLGFLEPSDAAHAEMLGRLGPYHIIEVLGSGGMGVVLKALDPALDRTVAIKVLTPALAHGATARRRFAREARAVAAVGHEHIVAIHAVDEFRGLPYLVMQYVPGRSLQERLDSTGPLEVRQLLRIGVQAARALAAAHAQGVVHRDIKPANILLENCIERVKLTDFGLARAINDASLTQSGVIAGTPQYMAPEQAQGEPVAVGADLFSLGAVLYAMAAGAPPFRADSALALLKRICETRHRPVREFNPDVPDWLEAVIDRLLAKDPADRFQSAAEVADLLERGLAHLQQPKSVPPPQIAEIFPPAAQPLDSGLPAAVVHPRRKLVLAAGLLLLLGVGLGASEATGFTQVSDFVATILRIKTPVGTLVLKCGDPGVKVQIDGKDVVIRGAGPQEIRLRTGLHRLAVIRDGRPVREDLVSITRGGKELINVALEPADSGRMKPGQNERKMTVPASHENQCLICHFTPQRVELGQALPKDHPPFDPWPEPAKVSGERSGARLVRGRYSHELVRSLAFAPDGQTLAIAQQGVDGRDSTLRVWDLAHRHEYVGLRRSVGFRSVAFSPDGRTLAAGGSDGVLTLLGTGGWPPRTEVTQGSSINGVAFLSDGTTVFSGSSDGWVRCHSRRSDGINSRRFRYRDRIDALAVSPDSSQLAVSGQAATIEVFEPDSGKRVARLKGHTHAVESLAFSPDGKLLASVGGLTARIWDTATWTTSGPHIHHSLQWLCVRFSPDGKLLAISDGDTTRRHDIALDDVRVTLYDVSSRAVVRQLSGHTNSIHALAFSPDGKMLATGGMDQTVKLWDVASGSLRETIASGGSGTANALLSR